ncbi:MAG: hypothetical protein QG594_2547 [Bacteroidota bacterium]|jgi:hypothetical protein|nr:hypothetical protein [Bacteroidota bacterium]
MGTEIYKIKKELDIKLEELRLKRKKTISLFKKKLEDIKINKIRDSILEK